jgi:hypothetical protein
MYDRQVRSTVNRRKPDAAVYELCTLAAGAGRKVVHFNLRRASEKTLFGAIHALHTEWWHGRTLTQDMRML